MKLIPVDINEINAIYKPTKNYQLLMEFHESDLECVEIVDFTNKNVKSFQTILITAAKRYGLHSIKVCIRGDRIFLIKDQSKKIKA